MPRRKRKRIVRQKGKRQGGPNREHQSASEVFSHKDCDITFVDVKKVRHQGEQALRSYTEDNYMCMSGDMSRNKAYTTALYVHLNTFASENDKKIVTILDVGTGAHALWLKTCARIWETELRQDPSRLLLLGIEIIPKSAVSALGVLRHATKSEARIVNKFSFDTTPSDFELQGRTPLIDMLVHEVLGNTMSTEGAVGTLEDIYQKFSVGVSVPFSASTMMMPIARPACRHLKNCYVTERLLEGRGFKSMLCQKQGSRLRNGHTMFG